MPSLVRLLTMCLIAGNPPVAVLSLPLVSANRDWIDVATLAVSAILMIVGIIGVIAAIRTLNAVKEQAAEMVEQAKQMKEQTRVAKDAADAALLNAKAVINSERPWLLIKPYLTFVGIPKFTAITVSFKATNVGRSPAEIIYAAIRWSHLLSADDLQGDRFFSENTPAGTQWAHTRWIAPNEEFSPELLEGSFHFEYTDAPESWKQVQEGTRVLILMGYIRYRDAISNDIHESRYCYSIWKFGSPVMTGPAGFNKLT
jgi:hypothetical protein